VKWIESVTMNVQGPSRTAEGAAALRVWHGLIDDPPYLVDDHAVYDLLSPPMRALLQAPWWLCAALRIQERLQPEWAALRGQVAVRGRFADDALEAALSRGCPQVVVLGAGLDTTALRYRERLQGVAVFEVDHPATQAWKRARLPADLAERVHFVSVDFERDALDTALLVAGVRRDQPLFVSWLGGSYYLTPEAFGYTLAALARIAGPGSELIMDYWLPETAVSLNAGLLLAAIRVMVACHHEPLQGLHEPAEFAAEVAAAGWMLVEELDARAQRVRWLSARTDTLSVPEFGRLARLRNGPADPDSLGDHL
jgi:methyltransferase (TIGR00027 family)